MLSRQSRKLHLQEHAQGVEKDRARGQALPKGIETKGTP
jgi:hypothetical protein